MPGGRVTKKMKESKLAKSLIKSGDWTANVRERDAQARSTFQDTRTDLVNPTKKRKMSLNWFSVPRLRKLKEEKSPAL